MKRSTVLIGLLGALMVLGCFAAGCSVDTTSTAPESTPYATASTDSASASPTPTVPSPTPPRPRQCRNLSYQQAVSPTDESKPVSCTGRHTAVTFAVALLETLVDGRVRSVDSARIQDRVATECPRRFADFIGGSLEDRRLTMLRAVWFTPTLAEYDAGGSWYRCDVVSLATDERLAPLTGPMEGALNRPESRDQYALCATAQPGSDGSRHVACSATHSWRAVATVPFDPGAYPGVDTVEAAGESPCRDAGSQAADGALDYQWGYEWPTAAQWQAGQVYGICWVPDGA